MSKRATVKPDWLDAMLVGWGLHSIKQRGWPSINPMLQSGIPSGARSVEPLGVSLDDYRELEQAIDALPLNHKCAITRAYKPWTAHAMEDEWPATSQQTWCNWLKAAALTISGAMGSPQQAA
jgi:hypothetical protein